MKINPAMQLVLPLNPQERAFPSRAVCRVCEGSTCRIVGISGGRFVEVRCDFCLDEPRLTRARLARRFSLPCGGSSTGRAPDSHSEGAAG